jgi:hypothetical protein
MAPIAASIDVDRAAEEVFDDAAEDVFDYATDPSRFPDWQHGAVDEECMTSGR